LKARLWFATLSFSITPQASKEVAILMFLWYSNTQKK
jgi:hypothetical protein